MSPSPGRLKEIINRGGEKISPREVDEVLMDHPAIQQVVTFAVPHDKLGEDVAAAVVLREGASLSEKEVREFACPAAGRLQGPPQGASSCPRFPKGPRASSSESAWRRSWDWGKSRRVRSAAKRHPLPEENALFSHLCRAQGEQGNRRAPAGSGPGRMRGSACPGHASLPHPPLRGTVSRAEKAWMTPYRAQSGPGRSEYQNTAAR